MILITSCENNPKSEISDSEEEDTLVIEKVETPNISRADKELELGNKYQELVDLDILTREAAISYSNIESKYRQKRIDLQNKGQWDGMSEQNVNNRDQWIKNKKSEVMQAVGQDSYDKIQTYLKSKK